MSTASIRRAQELVDLERVELADLGHGYPANHFAWKVILDSAKRTGATSLVEIGVGHGNGLPHVIAAGLSFSGIDNKQECVDSSQAVAADLGVSQDAIQLADVEQLASMNGLGGPFDSLVALGILPAVQDQAQALRNMGALLRPGGEMFIECRNSLFSLFTFNRFTADFILKDLLSDVPDSMTTEVADFIEPRLQMERPPRSSSGVEPAQHNPLAVAPLFESAGLTEISVHPFHFHAALPSLESNDPAAFRQASLALEDDTSGWKGLFLCSAFLVRAVRPLR